MARALVAVVGALASLVVASSAAALTVEGATDPWQAWTYSHVPAPPGVVTVHEGACPDRPTAAGCAKSDDIWVRDIGEGAAFNRYTFLHEVGHIFDYRVMTERARDAFRALVGDPRPWRSEVDSSHERFAEAYMFCARHRRVRESFGGTDGYWVGPKRHRRICRLIRLAAAGFYGRPI